MGAPEDPMELLQIISVAEEAGGSVVAVLPPALWEGTDGFKAQLSGKEHGFNWCDERFLVYEPPWYVNRSKVAHLTAPLRICDAAGGRRLMVVICEVLDANLSISNIESFNMCWDRSLASAMATG